MRSQPANTIGLSLVTNAAVTWTTEYHGLAVTEMRAQAHWR
jgi:hypothetical protein